MTPKRWAEINILFHAALEHEPAQRHLFLAERCAADVELRQEVESLIASHANAESFIEEPASELAAQLLAEDELALVNGQIIGSFKIVDEIAAGGMGEVYLADDTRLGRKVALKFLPNQFTADRDRVRRFEQEARAASALNHPNIVTILEIGQTDSLHFIATEFVDGKTLREHMTNMRMTVGDVLDVAIQVGSALQAAHEAGIVHRDIKPENIMLRRDGVAKVLDFGLAKHTADHQVTATDGQGLPSTVKTNPGVVMGTVGYMSPEQARGQEVDARSDIWSLGVVLYEMLAGVPPFSGETPSHIIVSILESEPPTPTSFDPQVPAELERIALQALQKNANKRYQTVREMTVDLKNLKGELEVEEVLKRRLKPRPKAKQLVAGIKVDGPNEAMREFEASTAHNLPRQTVSLEYFVSKIAQQKSLALVGFPVLLLIAIGWTYFAVYRNKTDVVAPGMKSIIVLPVKAINAADRDDIYEIGIADSLIHRLSSMAGLKVRPLTTSQGYTDNTLDPIAAGREQQVDYVLASTYQLAEGKIRVRAQLINVASGQLEKTYQIEKDRSDVFAMQDAIATEVGNNLLARFGTASNHLTSKRGTTNEDAYRLYLQGMYLANQRTLNDALKAIEALEGAVQLDPKYARAWAGLGYTHRTVSLYTSEVTTQEAYQKSMEAINKALALDGNLSEAHSALCENKYLYEWDFAGAEFECKRALELDPESSQAHEIFSRYLMGRGRLEEALAEIRTAIDLEPTSKFYQKIYGRGLLYARRYPEAEAQLKRSMAMDQSYTGMYSWLTSVLALQGKESEAFEWLQKLLSIRKVDQKTLDTFKAAFETSGWRGALSEWLRRIDQLGGNTFDRALYNAQIGEKDEAFRYLEKVYERREIWMTYLEVDPRLDSLRDDPRFDELLKRVKSR
jgi:serine/threonine-protein kinase